MSPRKEVFQAVVYDPCSNTREPFIEQEDQLTATDFGRFKFSAMFLGLIIGFFVQNSTLGASLLSTTKWGGNVNISTFSFLWSFFTSAVAIVIVGFLRNLVSISFNATHLESANLLEDMLLHMESHFIFGALVGVCLAWAMTDILIGMKAHILYSVITSVVAVFWCRVMMWYFASNKNENRTTQEPLYIV